MEMIHLQAQPAGTYSNHVDLAAVAAVRILLFGANPPERFVVLPLAACHSPRSPTYESLQESQRSSFAGPVPQNAITYFGCHGWRG